MIRALSCSLALLLGLGVPFARADHPEAPADQPLGGLSLEQLMAIRVRAPAKLPQSIREAPAVGAVVTRGQIVGYGWRSLNDILFRQPGFAPARDYERVTVGARGLYEGWNNNHLLMLVDGIPLNNVSNGTAYTWEVMPLFFFDRVEVMRGPGSALYGTNATNGVLALHTRRPSPALPVQGHVELGTRGTERYELFGGHSFSLLDLTAGYSHHRTDGNVYDSYDGSGRTDGSGDLTTFPVADRRTSHFGLLKLDGRGPLAGLSVQAHWQYWSFQTGHGWLYVVPDEKERAINSETRVWLTYRPPPLLEDRLDLELVVLGQRHVKDYRIKYLPDGASLTLGGQRVVYPGGVVERIKTGPSALFARVQAQVRLWEELRLLLGIENHLVSWGPDAIHTANVDLNTGGSFRPFPDNEFRQLRPALEATQDHPIDTLSAFVQLSTGPLLRQRLAATVGARYDTTFFDYEAVAEPGKPSRERSFRQLSPRLGLVGFPHPALTLKLMAERAFRAPTPSELAVYNSLLTTSNTATLKPEVISTLTVAGDLSLGNHVTLRADWFLERFANQIAFSATQNLAANIYSRDLTGVEAEVLFDLPVGPAKVSGFLNYTYSHLLDEEVEEPTITARDRLTWAPAHVANAGLALHRGLFTATTQLHVQGAVFRRTSDHRDTLGDPSFFAGYRPRSVRPWATLDARVAARIWKWATLGLQGTNLTNTQGSLIKTNDYPFDYRIEGVTVLATIDLGGGQEGEGER